MTTDELRQKAIAGCKKVAGMSRWLVSAEDKRLAEAAGAVVARPIADPVLEAVVAEYEHTFARGASVPTIPTNVDWPRVRGWAFNAGLVLWLTLLSVGVRGCTLPTPQPKPPVAADISLPAEAKAEPGEMIELSADTAGALVRWDTPGLQRRELDPHTVLLVAKAKGRYRVLAWTAVRGVPTLAAECQVIVGDSPPVPPGPTPPEPVPPVPQGFRALLMYESGANNTKEQLAVLYSPKVQEYLDRKATDGKNGWRRWDQNIDNKYSPAALKTIVEAAKPKLTQLPALVIATAGKIDVYPMAAKATEDEALSLLKKYGGE